MRLDELLEIQRKEQAEAERKAAEARKRALKRLEDYMRGKGMFFSGTALETLSEIERGLMGYLDELSLKHEAQRLALKEKLDQERRARSARILQAVLTTLGAIIPGAGTLGALAGSAGGQILSGLLYGTVPTGASADIASISSALEEKKRAKAEQEWLQDLLNRLFPEEGSIQSPQLKKPVEVFGFERG